MLSKQTYMVTLENDYATRQTIKALEDRGLRPHRYAARKIAVVTIDPLQIRRTLKELNIKNRIERI